jgi:hypothetical protein
MQLQYTKANSLEGGQYIISCQFKYPCAILAILKSSVTKLPSLLPEQLELVNIHGLQF